MSMTCIVSFIFYYDRKQDAATTNAHSNRLIGLFKNKKLISTLITIWKNTDGCADQYTCDSALYLMSVLSQRHSIIFDWGISAPGHGKEVVDGINSIYKCYMYQLISTVQLPRSKTFDSQILTHSCTPKRMSIWIRNSKNICLRIIINM